MIHINEQSSKESSFLLNSQAHPKLTSYDNYYHNKQPEYYKESQSAAQLEHSKPLLSYLFFSGESSKIEERAEPIYDHQTEIVENKTDEKGSSIGYHLKGGSKNE